MLDYLECVSLTHPEPASDGDIVRLVRAILVDEAIRYDACVALVSHGVRVSRQVCDLLTTSDTRVIHAVLEALDANPPISDESIASQVENHLKSKDDDVRNMAMMLYAKITPDRESYTRFLCELASKERSMRFICMTSLSSMFPIPSSCRPDLERLLAQYAGDIEFLRTVQIRISEIEN